jgi:type I restriction enzyme S subunit
MLPEKDEQRRIADTLEKADAIRRKRKQAIALTEELLRSTFLEMFGDPVINPKGWPVKPLGALLSFLTSGSRGWAQYYAEAGETFLRIQNVRTDRLDLSDVAFVRAPTSAEARRTETFPGDVLLSITADLGRTAVVPETLKRAFINQHLAILRPNGVNSEYLSSFLASEAGQRQINRRNKGGVKAGLNFDDIRSIEVVLPPKPVQDSFGMTKSQMRRFDTRQLEARNVAGDLFSSLLARAFCPTDARC